MRHKGDQLVSRYRVQFLRSDEEVVREVEVEATDELVARRAAMAKVGGYPPGCSRMIAVELEEEKEVAAQPFVPTWLDEVALRILLKQMDRPKIIESDENLDRIVACSHNLAERFLLEAVQRRSIRLQDQEADPEDGDGRDA